MCKVLDQSGKVTCSCPQISNFVQSASELVKLCISGSIVQGNVYNASIDLSCDSTKKDCLPSIIADEYWIKVWDYM